MGEGGGGLELEILRDTNRTTNKQQPVYLQHKMSSEERSDDVLFHMLWTP